MGERTYWKKSRSLVQPRRFHAAGARQARRSELMAFPESRSGRVRVEGHGGLEIAPMAPGLWLAGHWANGAISWKSGLSGVVFYDCSFGKRKPCRERWCP